MFKVAEESNREAFFECLKLGEQQYNEIESNADVLKYNVNYKTAAALIEHNLVRVVTARGDDGSLLGYFGVLIAEDFLTSKIHAKELGIYLSPEVRGSSCFYRMNKLIEEIVKKAGAEYLVVAFKEGHDKGLASRLGYSMTEKVYQKLLGD